LRQFPAAIGVERKTMFLQLGLPSGGRCKIRCPRWSPQSPWSVLRAGDSNGAAHGEWQAGIRPIRADTTLLATPTKEARKLLIPQDREAGCFHPSLWLSESHDVLVSGLLLSGVWVCGDLWELLLGAWVSPVVRGKLAEVETRTKAAGVCF
jgi:hypothetical protein